MRVCVGSFFENREAQGQRDWTNAHWLGQLSKGIDKEQVLAQVYQKHQEANSWGNDFRGSARRSEI